MARAVDSVKHCEKHFPLKLNVVFEKEVIFHKFDFERPHQILRSRNQASEKHKTLCDKGVFLSLISQL